MSFLEARCLCTKRRDQDVFFPFFCLGAPDKLSCVKLVRMAAACSTSVSLPNLFCDATRELRVAAPNEKGNVWFLTERKYLFKNHSFETRGVVWLRSSRAPKVLVKFGSGLGGMGAPTSNTPEVQGDAQLLPKPLTADLFAT